MRENLFDIIMEKQGEIDAGADFDCLDVYYEITITCITDILTCVIIIWCASTCYPVW